MLVFFGSFCSAAENPLLTTEQTQLACAISSDEAIDDLTVTIDGGRNGRHPQAVAPDWGGIYTSTTILHIARAGH